MRRKINYKIVLLAVAILMGACDDWLYTEPENGIIRDDFWQSGDDVLSAMMGCYASLLGNTSGTTKDIPTLMFIWGEMRADWIVPGNSPMYEFYEIFVGDVDQENSFCRWNSFYRTINYCNTVLQYAPEVVGLDPTFTEENLKQYIGEALALRALMYFYLVRNFGEVPFKLEATTSDADEINLPKSSSSEILSKIKSDLLAAEDYVVYTYGDKESDKGRITKYTVNAIQSDVYLWCEQYDSCIIACNKIINSGVFGLVARDEDWFVNLYGMGNSVESIFELPFSSVKQNPFYSDLYKGNRYKASAAAVEEFFPEDASDPVDSSDIRSDGCSFSAANSYSIWKYLGANRDQVRASSESYAHFIVYRYAEILLNKAEALNQLGSLDESLKLVNTVRKRANAAQASYEVVTDRLSMGEFILNERSREFAFEGKRWYDILRNAKRNHYERIDLLISAISVNVPSDKLITKMNKYRDTLSHYLPIYYTELENNSNLVQNPFYNNY